MTRDHDPGRIPLESLFEDREPPPDLKLNVRTRIQTEWSRSRRRRGALAAAAVLLVASGYVLGSMDRWAGGPTPDYMLLTYGPRPVGTEVAQQRVESVVRWLGERRKDDPAAEGYKLGPMTARFEGTGTTNGSGGTLPNAAAAPSGVFHFSAPTQEEALEIARSHPQAGWPGWMVLHPIER